jgi:outer membrane immunogenic protein
VFGSDDRNAEFEYFRTLNGIQVGEFAGTGFISGGDLDWTATFRARLGPVLGDEGRLLIYGTGGLALAGINGLKGTFEQFEDGCFPCDFGHSNDTIRVGFAAGGGFEWALTDNVSLGAEYLFLGFGDWDEGPSLTFYGRDGRQFTFEDDFDHLHVARVTLNLRFPNP